MSLIKSIESKVLSLHMKDWYTDKLYCTIGFYELLLAEVRKITPLQFADIIYTPIGVVEIILGDITAFSCYRITEEITEKILVSYSTLKEVPTFTLDEIIGSQNS